jgi:alkanesulfonate monooxygenase SsuD/methylene tetrahydromethanopterin reductase-like flavin-dependent oxidoreductase (luciferase family)
MKAFPKPYQHPHPPIIMGGEGEKALECAAEVCDGWAPWLLEWSKAKESLAELKRQAAANGRDPDSLEFSVFEKSIPDPKTMAEMESAGVKRIILTLSAQAPEEALPVLDQLAKVNR